MSKFLRYYLIATGLPAGLALAVPWLVTIGFFFFILPGMVLFFAPTAFLWGCIYAAIYWPLSFFCRLHVAAICAVLLTGMVLWVTPEISINAANERLSTYQLDDVTPAGEIRPQGDVRIDRPYRSDDDANGKTIGFRKYACDDQCLALLFEPNVLSVTVTEMPTPTYEAIRDGDSVVDDASFTYRLLPKAQCAGRGLDPDLSNRRGYFGHTTADNVAMVAEWGLRLAKDFCLVGDAPLDRFDMLIRMGTWRQSPAEPWPALLWSMLDRKVTAEYYDIWTGDGALLFRRFNLETEAVSKPLQIYGHLEGGGSLAIFFGWAIQTLPKELAFDGDITKPTVDTVLDVRRRFDLQAALTAARDALSAVLAEPSSTDGQLTPLVENYMAMLDVVAPTSSDVVFIANVMADARIHDLPDAWVLPRSLSADQLLELLPAIVHNLAIAPEIGSREKSDLGAALERWPAGTFTNPSQEMLGLLADPIRRQRSTGLISRLSDSGKFGSPIAAGIIDWHVKAMADIDGSNPMLTNGEKNEQFRAHRATIAAARIALCRLGPDAAAELPKLKALEPYLRLEAYERREWDMMLLRLGYPLADVTTPLIGGDEQYRATLARWLASFNVEKSCD